VSSVKIGVKPSTSPNQLLSAFYPFNHCSTLVVDHASEIFAETSKPRDYSDSETSIPQRDILQLLANRCGVWMKDEAPEFNLRTLAIILLMLWFGANAGLHLHAQTNASQSIPAAPLPDAPGQASGIVNGSVLDVNGAEVEGAVVTLEGPAQPSVTTDNTGSFQFNSVQPGTFKVRIAATGFAPWVSQDLVLHPGEHYEVSSVKLQIAETTTNVDVTLTRHDIAEEQVTDQEKQRVLGVFPNFYVSYVWNAAPMSAGQKFRLALRSSIDPVSIASSGVTAGVQQWRNDFSGYGQGMQGYAKRFGASYADGFLDTMLGGAILPSLLHQDPRYFYKGTGSISSRALYAIATVVICKGDNGRWQPNYSNVLGNLASAGISNLYYPASDRNGAGLTIENSLIGTASSAASALVQEFLIKKISRGIPHHSAAIPTP